MDGRTERGRGLKLFGFRIVDAERSWNQQLAGDSKDEAVKKTMPKSVSMVDLAACSGPAAAEEEGDGEDHGCLSDGGLERSSSKGAQGKKRGVPWTEEEHQTFLTGLEKLGKGDWRGISRGFVMTRTPTQVASHAQKYFLRKNNPGKKKRRSSLFDAVIPNKIANPETPPSPPPPQKKSEGTFELLELLSSEKHLGLAALSLCPNQSSSLDQAGPTFLKLSSSSTVENGDLELTIAPPQPHGGLASFTSGIIRVV
ncbi:hypothetical protein KSP40_PGU019849 [Platanthera guangdongensis]|uniref:MYB transcription factor n=1 Tax=Platanthera guangdongensis TaxID=2320717 RepID=A0ABR2MN67_9ASPA